MKISPVQSDYKDVINLLFKIVFMVQCQVSVQRINKFMNSDELDPESALREPVLMRKPQNSVIDLDSLKSKFS